MLALMIRSTKYSSRRGQPGPGRRDEEHERTVRAKGARIAHGRASGPVVLDVTMRGQIPLRPSRGKLNCQCRVIAGFDLSGDPTDVVRTRRRTTNVTRTAEASPVPNAAVESKGGRKPHAANTVGEVVVVAHQVVIPQDEVGVREGTGRRTARWPTSWLRARRGRGEEHESDHARGRRQRAPNSSDCVTKPAGHGRFPGDDSFSDVCGTLP